MRTKTGAAIVTLVLAYCLPMADAASMRSDGVQRLASLARRASQKTIDFFSIITNQMQSSEAQSNQLTFTLENGAAASDPFSYQTAGLGGPLLLQSTNLLDTLAHFVRERIPERVVHARGLGAHGTVEITTDFAEKFMCSPEFKMGQKHPATCRFSTVGGASGSPDLARDPRGFACKIRTKSGTLDWVFNNTPIFFIRDPTKFPLFIHTQKTDPATHLRNKDMFMDWIWQNPESLHQMFRLFSDLGTPMGVRHMNGWSGHTFRLVQCDGSWVYVKVRLSTNQGVRNFTAAEATKLGGENQEWSTQDLYEAIDNGKPPSWTIQFSTKTEAEAAAYRYDVNDLTKDWYDAVWHDVGKLTLDQNPRNYFAEIEQSHFSPSNMIPGWAPSEDPVLQSRLFSYNDAGRYRLGANAAQIPVNCPLSTVANFDRDGHSTVLGNQGDRPMYPASWDPYRYEKQVVFPKVNLKPGAKVEHFSSKIKDIDYEQPRYFFEQVLSDHDKANFMDNWAGALSMVKRGYIVEQLLKQFRIVNPQLAEGVSQRLAQLKAKATSP